MFALLSARSYCNTVQFLVQYARKLAEKMRRLGAPRGKSVRPVLVYDGHLAPIVETEGFFDVLIPFRGLLGL